MGGHVYAAIAPDFFDWFNRDDRRAVDRPHYARNGNDRSNGAVDPNSSSIFASTRN